MPKYYISQDTGCVYWIEDGEIVYAPITTDNTFNTEEAGAVDEYLMKGEILSNGKLFEEHYAEVKKALEVQNDI